jgi:hypothetical protein
MVKLIRDFVLPGTEDQIFGLLRQKLPEYLNSGEDKYVLLEEIKEETRLYRKARLIRASNVDIIPNIIKERLPQKFIDTATCLIEETIFYEEEHKIQLNVRCEYDDVYNISGSVRFIPLDKTTCKVVMVIYMELNNMEKYIPTSAARDMIVPVIESRIPELFIEKQKMIYTNLCSSST